MIKPHEFYNRQIINRSTYYSPAWPSWNFYLSIFSLKLFKEALTAISIKYPQQQLILAKEEASTWSFHFRDPGAQFNFPPAEKAQIFSLPSA